MTSPLTITQLPQTHVGADDGAADRLFPLLYDEVRRLAHRQLRAIRRPGATLNTTALVNEAYLKLVDQRGVSSSERAHFLALVARAMRQIVIDRDQTCRFPGCTRLAQRCDTDHRIPWPAGPTSISNGCSLCEHHHQAKHALLQLTKRDDGTLRWTLPTGHHADVPPRALLQTW